MGDDPFFCDDCGMELGHDDVQVAKDVPQIEVENFKIFEETADVYQCSGCGLVIGFNTD
jgi:hypothetical protein